ncbi:dTMP kinase [Nocardia higoensis]|uniref:dTMP kinase n=1 Tax=Nocardia higoensis TaxID=228599 RepID=UPI000A011606|nr:dTMP kinase [Nocardia higoensis]
MAGALITIDGAGGVGKSTTAARVADCLASAGTPVYLTTQPSRTALGTHIREGVDTYRGMSLACLVAADRHHQQVSEIQPALEAGTNVICDRYLPSSLVLQVIDGVRPETVWQLNTDVRVPDVAVILRADPVLISTRLSVRGPHNRFEREPDSSVVRELEMFDEVAENLRRRGWPVHVIDCTGRRAGETARAIADLVLPPLTDGRPAC